MPTPRHCLSLPLALLLGACVTINVYFPAAAAEQAADRIIEDVWGRQPPAAKPDAGSPPQSFYPLDDNDNSVSLAVAAVLNWLVPPAYAQDINVATPAINAIKNAMAARHKKLLEFYNSGAIGLTANGDIAVRDANAAPLAQRNQLKQLVSQENQDRARLYKEIAVANGQPAWEAKIRSTFAQQWIEKARGGWWYQAGGGWRQK